MKTLSSHEFIGTHMNRAVSPSQWAIDDSPDAEAEGEWILVFPHFKDSCLVTMPEVSGAHVGADAILHAHLYGPPGAPDAGGRTAGHDQGAASITTGIAAVASIANNQPVHITGPLKLDARRLSELV